MNKIYKVVWSKVKHCYVVTSELAKRQTKGCGARSLRMATVSLGVAASLLCAGAVLPIFGESVAEAGSVGYVNKLFMGDGLEWNGSTTAVTITADTIDTINNNINADPRKHAYGNITYTYGSEKFNAIAERDVVSFKVVDGQLIECHDAPITVIQQYPSAMDGYDTNKDVSGYSITINNTSDKLLYAVYGGYSKEGNVSSNSATITNGTITNTVYGGYSGVSGNVENNNVTINGGTIGDLDNGSGAVYGAYTYNGLASNNTITINSGSTVRCPTAGSSYNGKVEENTLNINGGTIVGMAFGGVGNGTYVKSNTVNIKNDATVNATVYGGMVWGDSASDPTDVTGNTVNISDTANVNENVYGGYTYYGKVSNNTVNLNGGSVMSAYGGYTQGGAAETNHVVVYGGVAGFSSTGPVAGSYVYGGYSKNESGESKDVTGNTVTVKKGTVLASIFGGRTEASGSSGNSGDAIGNIVTVEDGTLAGDMYGGYSSSYRNTSGKVEGNKINITGGALDKVRNIQVNGIGLSETAGVRYIYGGYTDGDDASGIAKDNEVTISGGTLRSDVEVAGGYSNANNAEHNIVNIESTFTGTVGKVTGGEAGGNGTVTKNEVTIAGGTVTGFVTDGISESGNVQNNEVTVSGGTVGTASASPADEYAEGVVYGAYSVSSSVNTGDVTGNTVTIKSGTVGNTVQAAIGGFTRATGSSGNSGKATGNTVTIEGGTIKGIVRGGASMSSKKTAGEVKENNVIIKGGKIETTYIINQQTKPATVTSYRSDIYGGYLEGDENSGVVQDNTVTISGGDFTSAKIYGGYSNASNAVHNTVEFTKDFTAPERNSITVAGGASISGNAIKNVVAIGGGNIGRYDYNVYGGYSETGTAGGAADEGNTVTITGGKVEGSAVGGFSKSGAVKNNVVTVSGSETEVAEIYGGSSWTGTVSENTANIQGGRVSYAHGGVSSDGTANGNKLNISRVKVGGGVYGGDAPTTTYNAVTISGDAEISTPYLTGGRSFNYQTGGVATGNTFTIRGGTFSGVAEYNYSIVGGFTDGNGTAKDNAVNLTGAVTGLENFELYGYVNATTHSGNELHIGGTKTYDSEGNATVNSGDVWQGKSSDGTVNNKVESVSNFERIVLHNVAWNEDVAALEAATVENVGTLDIKDLKFDQTPTSGSMALLKSESILGVGGVGIGLAYKDGSTEKTATSAELATGVTFDSGALVDTAVGGVTLTGTQSKKVSLEDEDKTIMYSFSSSVNGITIATDTFTAGGTARKFGSGVTLTGATITNNLAFSDESKKNMASGTSMVILDATEAVAVSGATLPAFTAQTYQEKFDDPITGKVLTLSGTHTDTLALNTAQTQLIYTVGDQNVNKAAFNGEVTWDNSQAYYTADTKYKFGATDVDAENLKVTGTTSNVLKTGDAMTLLSASGLSAGTVTPQSDANKTASKIAVNYTDTASVIAIGAEATGEVKAATNAVSYEVTGVALNSVDLTNWNGTTAVVSEATAGWTVKSGASITTGDLANAGLDTMDPGEVKPILTADTTADFSVASISGNKAWQAGGTITDTDTSGVSVTGITTGGGVKVDDTNKNVLVYQKDAKTITGITLGSVAFTKDGTVRSFDNSYNLTGADFTTTGFGISNASTATMNAGDTMVVVDAVNAIKGTGDATLQDFTTTNAGDAIAFTDQIEGKALTLSGTHQDMLEQNEAKNQILYKVGDKNVTAAIFTGEVAWNDSEAYYTNDTSKYKIAATNVDATDLKVTGTSTKALQKGDAMTLFAAEGMTATLAKDQSDANKTASKITVNYSDATSGIGFGAEATGAVETAAGAVNYKVTGVTMNRVDLAGWNGTTSSVPGGWAIADGATINTDGLAAPAVEPGSHVDILQNDTDNYFASATISGANTYQSTDFKDEMNGVTLEGKQDKGVTLNSEKKHLIYAAGTKNTASVGFGAVEWQKDATLADAAAGYDFTNVSEIGTDKFDVTYAKPEDVAINDSMTLLKANETLTAIVDELKTSSYKNYEIAPGVLMDGSITGTMSRSGNDVVFTATANQADKLTFTNVEWKDSGALLTRPANVMFAGADVDTAKINFHNIQELAANSRMTLVSDFGETVGTITGDTFTVGSGLKGEGAASLSSTDLVFTAKTGAESLTPTEATHETVMAMEAGTAVVAAGREYVDSAVEGLGLVSNMAPDGTSTFASMGGGVGRYKTGSHVDTHTWNAVVAVGSKRDHKKGNLEWGVFAEYGRGNYTLHDDNGGRGDGNTHYAGGGLLAKWTNKHDVYTEASFRMGRMSDSASNMLRDVLGNTYGYDVHANYFGGHVGFGKIYKVQKTKDLDVYGKFFYTRRNGVDFDAGGNHYSLDSVASKLLRIGARYGSNDRKWNWYGGLAYEYEFGGESKGTVDGLAIRSASIKGASVRGEIGVRLEATKTNPWKADISIYGYGGKHRGIGGTVSVAYMF